MIARDAVAALPLRGSSTAQRGCAAAAGVPTPDFSPREMQTLYLMIRGRSRREIARSLDLSIHTVDDYQRTVFEKARVRSRIGLMRQALIAGWARC